MNFDNKKIGIWGFGIVGQSALNYFKSHEITTTVMDSKELSSQEQELIDNAKSIFVSQSQRDEFLNNHDLILASPGINLRPFQLYKDKFITELDLFSLHNKKKIIAITGTIGKTTITHFLSMIIQNYTKIATGGNIGTGMLDLLSYQNQIAMTLLEISSFQLEYCKIFAPDLAIWTNFFPNHLDRHSTIEEYFNAKYSILARQKKGQHTLVPLELADKIREKNTHNQDYRGTLHFFSVQQKHFNQPNWLSSESNLFWLENNTVMHSKNNRVQKLLSLDKVTCDTYAINMLIIVATLHLLEIPLSFLHNPLQNLEHRLEKIAFHNEIEIYNDSKATIMESTIAAINKLKGKPIILFLGGLSKGVNRTQILEQLQNQVKCIVFFGAESKILHQSAQKYNLKSSCFETLDEAVNFGLTYAQPGDQILFSPGGSSYDLYTDYKKRGEHFKKLIHNKINRNHE